MERIRALVTSRWAVDGAVLILALVPVFASAEIPAGSRMSLEAFRVAAALTVLAATASARRVPWLAAAMPTVVSVSVTGSLYTAPLALGVILFAFALGCRVAGRRALILLAATLAVDALALLTWPQTGADDWFELGSTALLLQILPWTVGQVVHQQTRLVRAGWDLAERLEREQDRVADQVRLRERARIATDMHDTLGHELSLIAVRAAALQVDPRTSDEGRRVAGELREAAADATERLRTIIGMLRDDGAPAPIEVGGNSVAALVQRARESGIAVTLADATDEHPSSPPLPEATVRAAYRTVQEGLTNAARHAPGRPVRVRIRRDDDQLLVIVANDLVQVRPDARSGYGLVGLDERVRLAGGTLTAGPFESEFQVRARLPVRVPAQPTPPTVILRSRHAEANARRDLLRALMVSFWPPAVIMAVLVLLYFASPDWT